jgi:hypothetical protein
MKKICASITCALLFILSLTAAYSDDEFLDSVLVQPLAGYKTGKPALELKNGVLHYQYSSLPVHAGEIYTLQPLFEEDDEYEETPARRFEIIFLISLPMTLALSFAGLAVYKAASDTWGDYQNTDYIYLALSSISLSLSVAIHDHRVIYKKRGT